MSDEANTSVNTDPFISRVSLGNFKSVVDQEVDLARLTLLVGENSSGKSSVLQALRLVQQAVKPENTSDYLPLNGDSIQMGTINEIRTVGAQSSAPVSIGIKVHCGKVILNWKASFSGVVADEPGSTNLKSLYIETQDINEDTKSILSLRRNRNKPEYKFLHFPYYDSNELPIGSSDEKSGVVDLSMKGYLEPTNAQKIRISGVKLSGFVPTHLAVKYSMKLLLVTTWLLNLERLISISSMMQSSEDVTTNQPIINTRKELVEFAIASISEYIKKFKPREFSLDHFYENISYPPSSPFLESEFTQKIDFSFERDKKSNAIMAQYIRNIASNLDIKSNINVIFWDKFTYTKGYDIGLYGDHWLENIPLSWSRDEEVPDGLAPDEVGSAHFHYVMDKICYLGPLRRAPSIIMLSSPGSASGIGQEGELTASVLRYSGNKKLDKIPVPDGIESDLSLSEAVGMWVSYLGLADNISAEDLAGLGITMKVKPSGVK